MKSAIPLLLALTVLAASGAKTAAILKQDPAAGSQPGHDKGYKLIFLGKSKPGDSPRIWHAAVSVENWLTESEMEDLVCRVVADQQPKDFDILRIFFFKGLKEYKRSLNWSPKKDSEDNQLEKAIGSYGLNTHLSTTFSLNMYRDKTGKFNPKGPYIDFDHRRDCPVK